MTRNLSRTERDVLRLFGAGRSPRQIAAELGIADTTVLWVIGHLVTERGVLGTNALANALSRSRRRWAARIALPLTAAIVLTLGAAALANTGSLHFPVPAATSDPEVETASPAAIPTPNSRMTLAPNVPVTSVQVRPRPVIPTVGATTVPSLPLPLPPLPTVPPLSTRRLPAPLTAP